MSAHPPPLEPKSGGRIPALDGVRGLAILIVLFYHFTLYGGMRPELLTDQLFVKLSLTGWSGVDLFFVLSGFLITGILVDARGGPFYFRNFYVRRVLRIFPLYYGVLVLFFVVWPPLTEVGPDYQSLIDDQAWYWSYLANVNIAREGWGQHLSIGHFWSLAVEEQFYVIWPAVVFLTRRRGLIAVCLFCIAAALALRVAQASTGYGLPAYVLTSSRMDALALGGLLAVLARDPGGLWPWRRTAGVVGAIALASLVTIGVWRGGLATTDPVVYTVGFTLFAALFGALVVFAGTATTGSRLRRFLGTRSLVLLGRYSYGLYVFHHLVIGEIRREGFRVSNHATVLGSQIPVQLLYMLGAGAIVGILAVASWHCFEAPILRLKSRFPTAPAPTPAPGTPALVQRRGEAGP